MRDTASVASHENQAAGSSAGRGLRNGTATSVSMPEQWPAQSAGRPLYPGALNAAAARIATQKRKSLAACRSQSATSTHIPEMLGQDHRPDNHKNKPARNLRALPHCLAEKTSDHDAQGH